MAYYMYRWTTGDKKRHTIYSATLEKLREKEEEIQHDLRDGIRTGESNITLNDVYEMWKKDKVGLKQGLIWKEEITGNPQV